MFVYLFLGKVAVIDGSVTRAYEKIELWAYVSGSILCVSPNLTQSSIAVVISSVDA